jgi:2-keto-4-pentenoate hydratase
MLRVVQPVDPRLRAAFVEQRARRNETLAAGARHVGWKLGTGERESIGGSISVGYITSASVLEPGGRFIVEGPVADLRADVELAVELADDGAIVGYGTSLELCDVSPVLGDAEAVIAANIFHRAVAFGPMQPSVPEALRATASVNGGMREAGEASPDVAPLLGGAAEVLRSAGLEFRPGDRVITGLIVQVPVAPGDRVEAEIEELDRVALTVA